MCPGSFGAWGFFSIQWTLYSMKERIKKKKKVGIETVPQLGTKVTECIAISERLAF